MRRSRQAAVAAAAYLALTLVMTWPLARGLARDVPSDLGDPLFVMWVLAWDAEQLRAIVTGDFARVWSFFDANIFHPAPLTLAYSEHLFAQALQIFPIYAATADPILSYNLLYLSTFVLSGLGGFLFVREISGNARAGFVAGLLFAFALYRSAHMAHLQILSAQWMPFALYGFRRYFESGRLRPLAGAAAALTAQNLSCGYYLLYFAPMAMFYVLWEIASRRLWRRRRTWLELVAAAALVAMVTVPFLIPYARVRSSLELSRNIAEVVRFSADVHSYFTAPAANRIWGAVAQTYPKAEGDLFPGAVPLVLAIVAITATIVIAARTSVDVVDRTPRWVLIALGTVAAAYAFAAAAAVFTRRLDWELGLFTIRATNVTRLFVISIAAAVLMLSLSPAARARLAVAARRPEAIMLVLLVTAWWLSLGPSPRVLGRPLDLWSPYRVLYDHVPGFDGVRAPARFAMPLAFALSMLGGLAIVHLERFRVGAAPGLVVCAAFLIESNVLPFPLNRVSAVHGYATPEPRVYRPARAPAVYNAVAALPPDAVILEMPFGLPDYDVRSVYYTTAHWRRLANGYSGFFPPHYGRAFAMISAGARGDDAAWEALESLSVTHVVMHHTAYLDDEGSRFADWLRQRGAIEIFTDGRDTLLALPR